jgi:SAM-dependent methyltransferase
MKPEPTLPTQATKGSYARTHVYLGKDNAQPKHMFVCIADLIAAHHSRTDLRLLDVGCASGAFVAYALQRFEGLRATGVDFDPALVAEACARIGQAHFEIGDANRLSNLEDAQFHAVTMTGTHSIFDDFRPSFAECIRVCAPGGICLITGLFNPYPVDALIHWRLSAQFDDAWHPGYNLFSRASVASFLRMQERVAQHHFVPFELPFDLAPVEDPIRSWTEPGLDSRRGLRNGIMPLTFETLVIELAAA